MKIRNGQTLIEMLIAFAVIGVGLFAAVTLVYSNYNLVQQDAEEVVAVNAAREGVELSKQMRDSNWLAGTAFDAGLANGTDYTATPIWEGVFLAPGSAPSFSFTANDLSEHHVDIVKTRNGILANAATEANIDGDPTPYKRLLTFHPICGDYTVLSSGADCPGSGQTKIGVRVESHVRWTTRGKQNDTTIYEDLYDWR